MKHALAGDHDHLMNWLFEHGANGSPEALAKILREISLKGRYKAVAVLARLEAPLDLAFHDMDDQTALIVAAGRGHVSTCEALVEAGAGLEVPDSKGITPLVCSSSWGEASVDVHIPIPSPNHVRALVGRDAQGVA
jgi:ankyrin repeat protein